MSLFRLPFFQGRIPVKTTPPPAMVKKPPNKKIRRGLLACGLTMMPSTLTVDAFFNQGKIKTCSVAALEQLTKPAASLPTHSSPIRSVVKQISFTTKNIPSLPNGTGIQVVEKQKNQYLIQQPFADYQEAKDWLKKQGLTVVGILGTSHIGKVPPSFVKTPQTAFSTKGGEMPMGYHYLNLSRLNAQKAIAPIEFNHFLTTPSNEKFLRVGFFTTLKGETIHLDYSDLSKEQIIQKIETLKKDPTVLAITLNAKPATPSPQAGELAQERVFMAFDQEGRFLGSFLSPSIKSEETLNIAKQIYGSSVGSVNIPDGSLFAKTLLPFNNTVSSNDPLAQEFLGGLLLVQPTKTLSTISKEESIPQMHLCAFKSAYYKDALSDFSRDILTNGGQKTNQKIIMTSVNIMNPKPHAPKEER